MASAYSSRHTSAVSLLQQQISECVSYETSQWQDYLHHLEQASHALLRFDASSRNRREFEAALAKVSA